MVHQWLIQQISVACGLCQRHTAVGDMKRLLATEKELQSASDEMLNIAPVYQPSQLAIDASHSQRLRNLVRAERQPVQRLAPYVHR